MRWILAAGDERLEWVGKNCRMNLTLHEFTLAPNRSLRQIQAHLTKGAYAAN